MVNITWWLYLSGKSLEILTSKRGDGLFTGEWFCGGVYNAVRLREALLYSIDLLQAVGWTLSADVGLAFLQIPPDSWNKDTW